MARMDVEYRDAVAFVDWLTKRSIMAARGDKFDELTVAPKGRFWLGRIAPEESVRANLLGARGERLEPCEIGIRVRPATMEGRQLKCSVRAVAWYEVEHSDDPDAIKWKKTPKIDVTVDVEMPTHLGQITIGGRSHLESELERVGAHGLSAEIHAEIEDGKNGPELVVTLVNTSPKEAPRLDTNLYQAELEVDVGPTLSFILDDLPDSFRYDRRVSAYGVNGGVQKTGTDIFKTTDYGLFDRNRPEYWDEAQLGAQPDLSFQTLAVEPVEILTNFANDFERWTDSMWANEALQRRSHEDGWSGEMLAQAFEEAVRARSEVARVRSGVELLRHNVTLRRAFMLANRAFHEAKAIHHLSWRPFQLGFVLANLSAIPDNAHLDERDIVDTLWFATGGGKTETYLLFTLTAAFYDRLRGKREGITSWGRFPLRMLSLQQTQRFADVFAAAELIRQAEVIPGAQFSVGFFVGDNGTPNRIPAEPQAHEPDYRDRAMPNKYRVLIRCPFCSSEKLEMQFDQKRWALDHLCTNAECPWGRQPLPFRIVDDEIYRWLPTIVLGTLDKAASVSIQAAMRGFYGAPSGKCTVPYHGFTYAPRSKAPSGCLFPGCREQPNHLEQAARLYAPTIRMQDELHLLRDSLGSVDSHYEALLDCLQQSNQSRPKIIASSATLAGHDEQVRALYRRDGRVFPLPGPSARHSFWTIESDRLARRYIGLAPRGVTIEYANDQLTETLQVSVREALSNPDIVAREIGIATDMIPNLAWAYGVDVVYGTTLKDVEAAARSFEAQIPVEPLNTVTLTGRTPLDEVRAAMGRLTNPEPNFDNRIHLVAASSMLSHGVDIDRLNIMIMLGLPLATAEFVQTTARVGRAYPGLVFTLHKIARERDAGVYRTFPSFIEHLDRLIDPVPITSRSRRVLELTFPGLEQGLIYGFHEPEALRRKLKQLTTPASLKRGFLMMNVSEASELKRIIEMLGFTGALDENLKHDLEEWLRDFFRALNDPASSAQFVSDLFHRNAMRSLRDVEEQVPVYSKGGRA